jgi:hypothetical protein
MKSPNRDLLVLLKDELMSQHSIEQEVELLHELLYRVESIDNFCIANEVIDLNRFKIIRKPHLILQVVRQHELKPFQFICNKN